MRPLLLLYVVTAALVVLRIVDVPWAVLHLGAGIAGLMCLWQSLRYAWLCGVEERRIHGPEYLDRWEEEP